MRVAARASVRDSRIPDRARQAFTTCAKVRPVLEWDEVRVVQEVTGDFVPSSPLRRKW
jgi:hypothetical protein